MHKTTLEQWALLNHVVNCGSFAVAAQETHRSQSSVSYNLALLQERLGVALLRPEGRRSVLTPAGETLLAHVRPLLRAFAEVEDKASHLSGATVPRLRLSVDSIFPRHNLFAVMKQFNLLYPATQISLTEVLEEDDQGQEADVQIVTSRENLTGHGEWLMNVEFVAVAHSGHPLFGETANLNESTLSRYPQVRISGQERMSAKQSPSPEQWFFSTVDAAIEAVMYQLGYGWLPAARIEGELAAGILKPLPLSHGLRRVTPLHLVVREGLLETDPQIAALKSLLRGNLKTVEIST
ncbi:LysR family transcriptional regulator [Martelella alba]|uniref:LysR family transcriptional regulator n=1 Tax=Martelella alba TaxID=2590451 RepID=A0ABY2SFW9_9HYPH|nr:LysR family transcriptional regulator [Martelella alba]TKI03940.1 LysR family transcriptional regulator [Martelella alba]